MCFGILTKWLVGGIVVDDILTVYCVSDILGVRYLRHMVGLRQYFKCLKNKIFYICQSITAILNFRKICYILQTRTDRRSEMLVFHEVRSHFISELSYSLFKYLRRQGQQKC